MGTRSTLNIGLLGTYREETRERSSVVYGGGAGGAANGTGEANDEEEAVCKAFQKCSVRSTSLGIPGSGITTIVGIGAFLHLKRLNLKDNKISRLPDEMGQLQELRSLNLGSNKLIELPRVLGSLPLDTLHLFDNQIKVIHGDTLAQLTRMKRLNLSGNEIEELPTEIGAMNELVSLALADNKLRSIPRSLSKLAKLEELNLTKNELAELPRTLHCEALQKLVVVDNHLTAVPSCVYDMKTLVHLDVSLNRITELPAHVTQLARIKAFHFDNNPLHLPTMDVYDALAEFPPVPSLRELCQRTIAANRIQIPKSVAESDDKLAPRNAPAVCAVCQTFVVDEFINVVAFRNMTKEFGIANRPTASASLWTAKTQGKKLKRVPVEAKLCSYACFCNKDDAEFKFYATLNQPFVQDQPPAEPEPGPLVPDEYGVKYPLDPASFSRGSIAHWSRYG